ncbi:MAG: hypothetical protein AABZ06_10700 [Bdellovibrionota bacterium]
MKISRVMLLALGLLAVGAVTTLHAYDSEPLAAVEGMDTKYEGVLTLTTSMHKDVTGQISALFQNGVFAQVMVKTDKPVMGKTEFLSKEQMLILQEVKDVGTQLSLIYKIKGAPHSWYFVVAGTSKDNGLSFSSIVYKVAAAMGDIEAILKSGVPVPVEWKKVGTAEIKAIQ